MVSRPFAHVDISSAREFRTSSQQQPRSDQPVVHHRRPPDAISLRCPLLGQQTLIVRRPGRPPAYTVPVIRLRSASDV